MQATTITEVIQHLDAILEWSRNNQSRLGYFAAVYRAITVSVKEKLGTGFFHDDAGLEQVGVVFANRYFEAFTQHQNGQTPSQAWLFSFTVAERWWPIVLQHMLLGMNAHINLDLGIAVARTTPQEELPAFQRDFEQISIVLADMLDDVTKRLAKVWPMLALLDWIGGRTDEAIINFSLEKARDHAWKVANDLAGLSEEDQETAIRLLDQDVTTFGQLIRYPGYLLGTVTKIVRLGERGTIYPDSRSSAGSLTTPTRIGKPFYVSIKPRTSRIASATLRRESQATASAALGQAADYRLPVFGQSAGQKDDEAGPPQEPAP